MKLYCRRVVHLVVIFNVTAKLIVVRSRTFPRKELWCSEWRKIGTKFASEKVFAIRISPHHFISSCILIKFKYLLIAFQLTAFESAFSSANSGATRSLIWLLSSEGCDTFVSCRSCRRASWNNVAHVKSQQSDRRLWPCI